MAPRSSCSRRRAPRRALPAPARRSAASWRPDGVFAAREETEPQRSAWFSSGRAQGEAAAHASQSSRASPALEAKSGSGAFHCSGRIQSAGCCARLGGVRGRGRDEPGADRASDRVGRRGCGECRRARARRGRETRARPHDVPRGLAGGWADLILPSTGSLERDGPYGLDLEGRVQRLRRAVSPPCPGAPAWISKLAARFNVDIPPHAMGVFAELSEHLFRDLTHADIGLHASLPARQAYVVPEPATTPAPPDEAGGTLRLQRYRPLFSGPAVERVPELGFQRPRPDVELSAGDASRSESRTATRSWCARTARPSSCVHASIAGSSQASRASRTSTRAISIPRSRS